jgi:hypothetical protein
LQTATKEFTETLTGPLRTSIARKAYENGEEVLNTFHREMDLHVSKEGYSSRGEACELKMIEEDFFWTPGKDKKLITDFEWKCSKCGGRHAIQVLT